MIDHDFIDPELVPYYNRGCLNDPKSAGCQYFNKRYDDNVKEINPYSISFVKKDIYDYCYYNGTTPGLEGH